MGTVILICEYQSSGRSGYRVKMNTDPENTVGQTYIKGKSRDTARETAIWRAQYIHNNPFPAKRPETTKVRPARCPKPCNPLTDRWGARVTHAWRKRKKQAESTVVEAEAETEAELLSSRPAWVVDHNLASLWMKGLSEDMIPEELRLSPTEMAKLERLREWAADKAEETAQAPALPLQALTTPPPPPVRRCRRVQGQSYLLGCRNALRL